MNVQATEMSISHYLGLTENDSDSAKGEECVPEDAWNMEQQFLETFCQVPWVTLETDINS